MAITNTGYEPYKGKYLSPWTRWFVIAKMGIQLKYQEKPVRWIIRLSWAAVLYSMVIFWAVSWMMRSNDTGSSVLLEILRANGFSGDIIDKLKTDPASVQNGIWTFLIYNYICTSQLFFSMLISGIVGASLISNDSRGNSFLLYFSRPLTPFEYLLGKVSTVSFFIFCTTLFPSLAIYILSLGIAQNFDILLITYPVIFKIIAASFIIAVPTSLFVLMISSLFKQGRFPLIAWYFLLFIGLALTPFFFYEMKSDKMALFFNIPLNFRNLIAHMFDIPGAFGEGIEIRKLNPKTLVSAQYSLITICSLSAVSFFILLKRIKAPLKI